MTFKQAMLSTMSAKQRAKVEAMPGRDRRLFWAAAERIARRRIERKTGKKLPAEVDWAKWLDFLKTIIPLIMQLLVLFGL